MDNPQMRMGASPAPIQNPNQQADSNAIEMVAQTLPAWLTGTGSTVESRLRATIPSVMQEARRWLVHRGKKPHYCDGSPRHGRLDTPEETMRLRSFEEAMCTYMAGGYDGLGFALGNGWQGIDLDKVEANGLLHLVEQLPGYVERSPSGKGFHAIGYGESFENLNPNLSGVEAYSAKRFFTVTGDEGRGAIECIANFARFVIAPLHSPMAQRIGETGRGYDQGGSIIAGGRNFALTSIAGSMRAKGLGQSAIEAALLVHNSEQCIPPLPDKEVLNIARSIAKYPVTNDAALDDASGLFGAVPIERIGWPEPTPLPNALPPVDPFDAELLPVAFRAWSMDIAHRMQCPPDYPAVAALVAASSLIGARAVVQPKARDDWRVVANLWGVVIGRPGVKKSPALNEALKPLHRLQATEFERHEVAHAAWELDCKVSELAAAGREKKAKDIADKDREAARALLTPEDAPAEPVARSYIENDATVEALGVVMSENPWGLLAYRDELYGLLTSLDKPGQEGSRAFYLTSYDGNQGHKTTRIVRGITYIPRVCLAMIGGIQPGRIQEYVRGAVAGGSADDGLLQRFGLAVWPDVAGKFVHVDQWPDTPAKQTAWAVFDRLAALQPASDADPVVWRFTPAAQEIFVEWLVPFEMELRGDALHPAMVSHLAKYRKLIPALALVFALIDTPDSGGNLIGEAELIRALAWGDYLRSHAIRLYAAAVMPETADAATLLAKIRSGKLTDSDGVILDRFTPRLVATKHWAGLDTPAAVRKAADLLTDYDWLVKETTRPGTGGGRPSERYLIHPKLIGG